MTNLEKQDLIERFLVYCEENKCIELARVEMFGEEIMSPTNTELIMIIQEFIRREP